MRSLKIWPRMIHIVMTVFRSSFTEREELFLGSYFIQESLHGFATGENPLSFSYYFDDFLIFENEIKQEN